MMVRVEDYPELAALVAEREARRDQAGELVSSADYEPVDSDPVEAATGDDGDSRSGTVYAPMFTARAAAAAALARTLVTWEDADLEQLAGDVRPAARAWAHALDLCSERPEAAVPTSHVVAGAPHRVAGLYASTDSLDRLLVRHYGGVGRPVRLVSGAQLGHHDDQQYWVVTREQADAWRRARARVGGPSS